MIRPAKGSPPSSPPLKLCRTVSVQPPPGVVGGVSLKTVPQPGPSKQSAVRPPANCVVPYREPVLSKSRPATGPDPSSPPANLYSTVSVQAPPVAAGGVSLKTVPQLELPGKQVF